LQVLLGEVQVALDGRQRDGHDREAHEVHKRDQAQESQRQLALAGREERRARWCHCFRHCGALHNLAMAVSQLAD
jgi:hypothetical protein